jgi:signal peptide peptidase SppA
MILAHRFLNRPLALLPSEAEMLLDPAANLVPVDQSRPEDRTYSVSGGVAVVPIMGVLTHRRSFLWYDTTYDNIRQCLAHATANPEVRAIAMHVNSPGGDCAGCFDLADSVYAMRGTKPIWAILDETAASAAYAIASSADYVTVPRSGVTGSIGVIAMHADLSGMLDKAGIKVTTIKFGARKDDGSPTAPLKGEALDRMQAMVDKLGEMFVELVSRNRGMSSAKVRDTEAATYLGADGVKMGLADAVMSPDAAFLALLDQIS